MNRLLTLFAIAGLTAGTCLAADEGGDDEDVRKTVATYVAAFNQGDAAGVAACWADDCAFTASSGRKFEGKDAIQKGLETFFKENPGAKIDVEIASIQVDPTGKAVEEGVSRVTLPDQEPSETSYVAEYTRQDGQWKLTSVSEALPAPTHYEQLKQLEWMVGQWVDKEGEEGDSSVEMSCKWTKNRNFLTRSFAVSVAGKVDLEGTQVIGWDPSKNVIRSWLFDSDGGFGVGVWTLKDKTWTIQALQVLPDGRKASSVNIMTQVDENTITWESTGREVDGEVLPNVGPVTVVRKQDTN
jgi:uncharacterized protein (TIGR02246 family)